MTQNNLLATRKNRIIATRGDQIALNWLAYNGGKPYIDARLSRWPSESDTDFEGDLSATPPAIGRKDRAFLINYAKRIAHKINQYVFQTDVSREGIDPRFQSDVTTTGMSINQFMTEVSSLLTACRWCWVGIDRPAASGGASVAAREASGDRIYWQVYQPNEVIDWSFDSRGGIAWLLTERTIYVDSDPKIEAKNQVVRYLWEPGKVTTIVLSDDKEKIVSQQEVLFSLNEVPFIPCGLISDEPWWFDEVEMIQRAVMDLLSSRDTQIFKAVFALMVVSKSFSDQIKVDGITTKEARRKMGVGNPLVETAEESGLTRYLAAPTEVFEIINAAKKDLETTLFEIVGLNMSVPESRQVSSAEAKAWDHLDPETVLKERATMLEEIETKAVEMSARLGGGVFKSYTPVYGKRFDISDFAADMQAMISTSAFTLPPKAEKLIQRALVSSIGKRFHSNPQELKEALVEIDTWEPPIPTFEPSNPNPNEDGNQDQN